MKLLNEFPFINARAALILLRIGVALVFFLHALIRITNGTIPIFGGFLESEGLPAGIAMVWVITIFELAGSLALALGRGVRWWSAGFILLLLVGIVLIHAELGWFVGEHGTGGCEYSVVLILALLFLAADSRRQNK